MSRMHALFTLAILAVFHQSGLNQTPTVPLNLRYNDSSFVEGKTVIEDVVWNGFDEDLRDYGVDYDYPIYKTDFDRELRGARAQINRGELLDLDHVERVIIRLKSWLSTKGYVKADVSVVGEPINEDRMSLIFSVRRGPLVTIEDIDFIGSNSITTEEFLANFKRCSGSDLKLLGSREFDFHTQRCTRQLLYSHGFFNAKVLSVDRRLVDDAYNISVTLFEGNRYRFGKITIDGASVFSEKEILEWFGKSFGDIADGRLLQEFVYETLKEKYAEKGYSQFSAEFDPELVKPIAEGLDGTVNVQISIEEGKRFTVRRVEFVGVESEEAELIKNTFELKEGEIFVPSKLASSIDKINQTGRFSILDKDQDVEILTDGKEGNLDLVIILRKITP